MRKDIKLGLGRVLQLLLLLGNPHKELKYIHVAGTNGKGSTCAMLSHILVAGGYKTGLYTSPYIQSAEEMIAIDNQQISQEDLELLLAEIIPHIDVMEDAPTEFEIMTAAAFLHFYREKCDIVVLEVGMGGRLDATNVIPAPLVAIITALGMDHMEYLGTTIEAIAAEKAGIIKPGTKVCIIHPQPLAAGIAIREKCAQHGVVPYFFNDAIMNTVATFPIALKGPHQLNNATGAVVAVAMLADMGFKVLDKAVFDGLRKAKISGRFEVLRKNPDLVVDAAHNVQGIEAAAATLRQLYPEQPITFVFGVLADKDYRQMVEVLLPIAKIFYTVTPNNDRALPSAELAKYITKRGAEAVVCDSIEKGVEQALVNSGADDVICALGSLYNINQIRVGSMR